MKKLKEIIDRVLLSTIVTFMALLILVVTWQVISRFVLQEPSSFTDELSRYLMIWIALLGAAYMVGQNEHIAIDLFFPVEKYRGKEKLIFLLIFGFALVVLIVGGIRLVYLTLSLGQLSASLLIPLGYIYLVLPLSGFLISFYCFERILQKK